MCLQCHEHLSDDTVYEQLAGVYSDSFDNSEFTRINSTSVSHFIIAASGYNGTKVRDISIKVIDKYKNWLNSNLDKILNDDLTPKNIENKLNYLKENSIESCDRDTIINYINKLDII